MSAPTVQSIAQGVAQDIARFGHFQGFGVHRLRSLFRRDSPAGLCCIIANPTAHAAVRDGHFEVRNDFERALSAKINEGREHDDLDFVNWSDTTPTSEVIATLRSL